MTTLNSPTLGKHEIALDGAVEAAVDPGVAVDDPAALTSPATFNTVFASTEADALRDDVAEVRTQVIALLESLRDAGFVTA